MLTEPEVITRDAQPYVAIRAIVTMQTIGTVLPELHPQVVRQFGQGRPPCPDFPAVDSGREGGESGAVVDFQVADLEPLGKGRGPGVLCQA